MSGAWPDARKKAELRAKLSSLDGEFAHWRRESETGARLRKHHTQIRKVTGALDALRARIATELDTPSGAAGAAAHGVVDIEPMILDVHRIWEFFRSKLSQRYVPWFEPFLVAADQYAWECYDPIRKAVDPAHVAPADVREPPMVFFNGGWSPFTMSRGIEYEAEFVPEEDFPAERYREILRSLPFPVIGVPWYQVRHLPDAVLLGHEVGHAVEDDFHLTDRLRALIAAGFDDGSVPDAHREAWSSWLGEVFADLFGVLGGGAAFVSALMDLVAGPVDRIETERADAPGWGIYPPAALRVHITFVALDATGFATEREALQARWKATWPRHAMEAFEADAKPIVSALIGRPIPELGGSTLMALVPFAGQAKKARAASEALEARTAIEPTDARALLAFARMAFDASAAGYLKDGVEERVLDAIEQGQGRATRGGGAETVEPARGADAGGRGRVMRRRPEPGTGPTTGAAAATASASAADPGAVALGDRLFDRLATLRGPAPDG